MKTIVWKIISTLSLLSLLLVSCNKDSINSPIEMELKKTGVMKFSLGKLSDSTIQELRIHLSRNGFNSVEKVVNATGSNQTIIINDLSMGDWQLLVEAKDTSQAVVYRGEKTVDVKGNETTHVQIFLKKVSSSGDLSISVIWDIEGGTDWTKSETPTLNIGSAGSPDEIHCTYPNVIFDGSKYKMWYSSYNGIHTISYAYSDDGINWIKHQNNPVLSPGASGSWDDTHIHGPNVMYDGKIYKMWYNGNDGSKWQIGYATSVDGIIWQKHSEPILTVGTVGSWDSVNLLNPNVIFDGSSYKMWYMGYNGTNQKIGYATSADGIEWQKYSGNPVMENGVSGAWDSQNVSNPNVIYKDELYKMWYSGFNGTNWQIGYAFSSDGVTWTRFSSNPVLTLGTSGSFDDTYVSIPSVLYDGNIFKIWYQGYDGQNYRIGYATAP